MNEIDFAMRYYNYPEPKMLISYDRESFFSPIENGFRITFDTNVRYRDFSLDLREGSYGKEIFNEDTIIMEVKTNGGMPLWLSAALSDCKAYPTPCSKYKKSYLDSQKLLISP